MQTQSGISTYEPSATSDGRSFSAGGRRVQRRFYIGVGVFLILLSIVGFGPSIIDQSRRNGPPSLLAMAHGLVAGGWFLLFLTQATLVATKRTAIHRRLGPVGLGLAVTLIVLGYLMLIDVTRRGYDLSGDLTRVFVAPGSPIDPATILIPLSGFLNFAILVAAGLSYRHRSEIHKRLMLFAMVPLAGEPIVHLFGYLVGHWPGLQAVLTVIGVPIQILILSASAIYDRVSQGRIHPVSLWVPVLFFAWMNVLQFVVFPSAAWREFAAWLIL
jgi:hypothetical protein